MASAVLLAPVPAITGTRLLTCFYRGFDHGQMLVHRQSGALARGAHGYDAAGAAFDVPIDEGFELLEMNAVKPECIGVIRATKLPFNMLKPLFLETFAEYFARLVAYFAACVKHCFQTACKGLQRFWSRFARKVWRVFGARV